MRPLRIAHVLSSFALGGQERVAVDLAAAQVRAGHAVHAISIAPPPEGVLAADFRRRGATVHTVAKGRGVDLGLILRLSALFRREHIDVVHTHNPQPLFYGATAGRLAQAAVIHSKHGVNPDRGRKLWLRRFGGHLVHAYVGVSSATTAVARANHECWPQRLHTVSNGVELSAFGPDPDTRKAVRDELGIPHDAFVFGTVGRMSPEKDHVNLVRAAAPLLGPDTRLVIVGDGAEMPAVRASAAEVAQWVSLPGARRDVPRLLATFDVFVLSSRSEGLPLALVEAMATELPVVATDVGANREVLQDNGVIVPKEDERALREALAALRTDGARARALAIGARSRASVYDAQRMYEEYLALYRASVLDHDEATFARGRER